MILADKIINERKKNGWSQEELAEKLRVSRQAVSKWEGAQSVPDMQRILDMSRLFGVSTDYLLKDELEPESRVNEEIKLPETELRRVSMEQAREYVALRHKAAPRIALGVFLCLFGAAALVLLAGASEYGALSENVGGVAGVIFLLICIASAVAIFIRTGHRLEPFEYLEQEIFETEYGVEGMLRELRESYRSKYGSYIVIGVVLCILSCVPVLTCIALDKNDFVSVLTVCVLLLMVGAAVWLFIIYGVNLDSIKVLMQEGDYTPKEKKKTRVLGSVAGSYWLVATAVYLAWSFASENWDKTWLVWPVAGVLFPVILMVSKLFIKDKD